MQRPCLVIDAGACTDKVGYSGNPAPSFCLPATSQQGRAQSEPCSSSNPGSIEDFYQDCFFSLLRVDPEDHSVVLSEPASAMPEAREEQAEVS